MTTPLRVALFVEGSDEGTFGRRLQQHNPLITLWQQIAAELCQVPHFTRVIPISKRTLTALSRNLNASLPAMSGAGEGLDQRLARELKHESFDAAVVIFDLQPPWNPKASVCQRRELCTLYRGLAVSKEPGLAQSWKDEAQYRLDELEKKHQRHVPYLRRHVVLAVCIDPCFEHLLTQNERIIKRALGVENQRVEDWPRWNSPEANRKPDKLLGEAIRASRRCRPEPPVLKQIYGDMKVNKNEWGLRFLQELVADPQAAGELRKHPVVDRMQQLLLK